ncbi:hypothetical protein EON80_25470 [bacterium]|nr:MAG: hypothetical protein EON80_25470 [bacterium]
MSRTELEQGQTVEPLDAATIAAVQIGLDQIERGETVTLEQARQNTKRRYQEWRKDQKVAFPA